MTMRLLSAVALIAISIQSISADYKRSGAARHAFAENNACPATNEPKLPCPGWIIDHIIPLCAGGIDTPANMQWQTRENALLKDAEERRACKNKK